MKARFSSLLLAAAGAFATFSAAAADSYVPGSVNDPNIRAARFAGEDKHYLTALADLLSVQGRGDQGFEAAPEYWAALAEFYLSFGMRDRAEGIYRTVAAANADPIATGRARLRLAQFEYERGYLDEARASLLRAREKMPSDLLGRWRDLYARVLLAQGRFGDAVVVLDEALNKNGSDGYLRLNLGIALLNSGEEARGRTVLDSVGRDNANDPESLAIRDKANVTLGWHFLQNRLGASAKPVLSRVRSQGLFANRALLGLGWAELAPAGERQLRSDLPDDERLRALGDPYGSASTFGQQLRPGFTDDPYARLGIRSFRRARLAKNEEEGLKRALVYWLELAERDPQDPSVQEGWLAIPYALERLGAHKQSVQYYELAITKLEAARGRTATAIKAMEGGRMVETILRIDPDGEAGWMWELLDLPDAPETYYLQTLIAEHAFTEALKNYRDTRMMLRRLDTWDASLKEMAKVSQSQDPRLTPDPRALIDRASRDAVSDRFKPLALRPEAQLSAPGLYAAKAPDVKPAAVSLQLSDAPEKFTGGSAFQGIDRLRERAASLRQPVVDASREQARQLMRLGREELVAQKVQIEKYIAETRFALARLYDNRVPDLDQDEYEVFKDKERPAQGKDAKGEYEIRK